MTDKPAMAPDGTSAATQYLEHLHSIDIPAWQRGGGDWFTIRLFDLIAKADTSNRERIRKGFPIEVMAYEEWHAGYRWGEDQG